MIELIKTCIKMVFDYNIVCRAWKEENVLNIKKAYEELKANKLNFEKRYREEIVKNHPDAGGSSEKFKRITECYKYIREYLKPL
ncbi:hypothetical protein EHP00_491 [Ecytonucleospora hepatopenaei]|uniref:J domain-containing protein n=1 Tax=Ecytonucleospora hepatopenaei TaxID=646526 RepID=A0A1W0E470_9MICR|nr:hypothetical protein EHP00_491 [Ecytonucleospora hepatopenaei]